MFSPTNLIVWQPRARLVLYSIDQVARNLYNAGTGRRAADQTTGHLEQSCRAPEHQRRWHHQSDRRASKENDHETDAMSLPASWRRTATSSSDTTGDMETIVAFSRRASQIFTDEQGTPDHAGEFSGWSNRPRGNRNLSINLDPANQRIRGSPAPP